MSSGSVVGQRLRCAQTLSTCAVFVFQVLPNTVHSINLLQRVSKEHTRGQEGLLGHCSRTVVVIKLWRPPLDTKNSNPFSVNQ